MKMYVHMGYEYRAMSGWMSKPKCNLSQWLVDIAALFWRKKKQMKQINNLKKEILMTSELGSVATNG